MSDIEKQDAELKHKCQEKLRNATDTMEKVRLTILSRGSGSIKGIGRLVPPYTALPWLYYVALMLYLFAEHSV